GNEPQHQRSQAARPTSYAVTSAILVPMHRPRFSPTSTATSTRAPIRLPGGTPGRSEPWRAKGPNSSGKPARSRGSLLQNGLAPFRERDEPLVALARSARRRNARGVGDAARAFRSSARRRRGPRRRRQPEPHFSRSLNFTLIFTTGSTHTPR